MIPQSSKSLVLLLTACIHPNGMSFTKLQNPVLRQQQYEEALDFYLENTNYRIVFVENTNTNIENERYSFYVQQKRLEILYFSGNNYQKSLGKGYGEALIIKYAIEHSKFCQHCDYIVKVTGRLIIGNIGQLIRECSNLVSYNKKFVAADSAIRGPHTNSFFYIAHKTFYDEHFFLEMKKVDDVNRISFEFILFSLIGDWIKQGNKFYQFFHSISVHGISGGTGRQYPSNTISVKLKTLLKALLINLFHVNLYK